MLAFEVDGTNFICLSFFFRQRAEDPPQEIAAKPSHIVPSTDCFLSYSLTEETWQGHTTA